MKWVFPVRVVGAVAGVLSLLLGAALSASILSSPSMNQGDLFFSGSLILLGALMAVPWSRIRIGVLWYALFVALVLAGPSAVLFILAVNTWSAIHGAGGPGFVLAGVVLTVWAIQLLAIWSLRPTADSRS
jgi:hypothetical protein